MCKEKKIKLQIQNVSKEFYKKKSFFSNAFSSVKALNDVTLSIDNEKCYGIVGESGSGKTTLGRALSGLLKVDSGTFLYNDTKIESWISYRENRCHIQMVFQNPYTTLNPRFTIDRCLDEGLKNKKIKKNERKCLIRDILEEVTLSAKVLDKYPHELSGGERQRVAISRALIMEPEVLILDEPVSSLDVSIKKSILDLVRALTGKRSMIVLFISHDLNVIRYCTDYVFVMGKGCLVDQDSTENILRDSPHPYTRELINASQYLRE